MTFVPPLSNGRIALHVIVQQFNKLFVYINFFCWEKLISWQKPRALSTNELKANLQK